MAGIQLPDENKLPPGPLRDLVMALHALYRGAGRPGLRRISSAITKGNYRDTVSHEKVSAMLHGEGLPRWSKLEAVVRQLAAWHVPSRDPDSEAARFLPMWEAVQQAHAPVSSDTENGPQESTAAAHVAPASPITNTHNHEPSDQPKPLARESTPEISNNPATFDHDIFLLFATPNLDVARRIKTELESAHYAVWWDGGQLADSGALDQLTNSIKTCRHLVVLLSAAFAESPYAHEYLTQDVVGVIESAGVSIVPALYEMSPVPPALGPKEFADFTTSPNTGRSQLLTILRSIEGKVAKRPPGPTLHDAVTKLISRVTDAPELYVAVDLGGTKAYISIMTREADRLFDRKFTTKNHGDASALLGFLLTCIDEAINGLHKTTGIDLQEIKERKITAYGVAFAGPTDAVPGVVRDASNFHIRDFPLAERLRGHLHKPVFVENDANLGVLGEAWKGVARHHRSVIGIVVGTGIGGGIVVNRQLWRGSNSAAGEIGHMPLDPKSSVKCGCLQMGCFEALASRKAIAEELSRRKQRSDPDDVRWELVNLGSAELADYYADGDRDTIDVVREAAKWWGKAVRNLLNTLNPDIVFFGGGFVRQLGDRVGDAFLQPVKDEAKKCMNSIYALEGKTTPIVLGELENPMLVGACLLALRRSRGSDVTVDIIGSTRSSLSEAEGNALRSIYNYAPRPTRIAGDPLSDFHEDRLRRLRNLGLVETVDNLSFKQADFVKITALGRAVAEDIISYRE